MSKHLHVTTPIGCETHGGDKENNELGAVGDSRVSLCLSLTPKRTEGNDPKEGGGGKGNHQPGGAGVTTATVDSLDAQFTRPAMALSPPPIVTSGIPRHRVHRSDPLHTAVIPPTVSTIQAASSRTAAKAESFANSKNNASSSSSTNLASLQLCIAGTPPPTSAAAVQQHQKVPVAAGSAGTSSPCQQSSSGGCANDGVPVAKPPAIQRSFTPVVAERQPPVHQQPHSALNDFSLQLDLSCDRLPRVHQGEMLKYTPLQTPQSFTLVPSPCDEPLDGWTVPTYRLEQGAPSVSSSVAHQHQYPQQQQPLQADEGQEHQQQQRRRQEQQQVVLDSSPVPFSLRGGRREITEGRSPAAGVGTSTQSVPAAAAAAPAPAGSSLRLPLHPPPSPCSSPAYQVETISKAPPGKNMGNGGGTSPLPTVPIVTPPTTQHLMMPQQQESGDKRSTSSCFDVGLARRCVPPPTSNCPPPTSASASAPAPAASKAPRIPFDAPPPMATAIATAIATSKTNNVDTVNVLTNASTVAKDAVLTAPSNLQQNPMSTDSCVSHQFPPKVKSALKKKSKYGRTNHQDKCTAGPTAVVAAPSSDVSSLLDTEALDDSSGAEDQVGEGENCRFSHDGLAFLAADSVAILRRDAKVRDSIGGSSDGSDRPSSEGSLNRSSENCSFEGRQAGRLSRESELTHSDEKSFGRKRPRDSSGDDGDCRAGKEKEDQDLLFMPSFLEPLSFRRESATKAKQSATSSDAGGAEEEEHFPFATLGDTTKEADDSNSSSAASGVSSSKLSSSSSSGAEGRSTASLFEGLSFAFQPSTITHCLRPTAKPGSTGSAGNTSLEEQQPLHPIRRSSEGLADLAEGGESMFVGPSVELPPHSNAADVKTTGTSAPPLNPTRPEAEGRGQSARNAAKNPPVAKTSAFTADEIESPLGAARRSTDTGTGVAAASFDSIPSPPSLGSPPSFTTLLTSPPSTDGKVEVNSATTLNGSSRKDDTEEEEKGSALTVVPLLDIILSPPEPRSCAPPPLPERTMSSPPAVHHLDAQTKPSTKEEGEKNQTSVAHGDEDASGDQKISCNFDEETSLEIRPTGFPVAPLSTPDNCSGELPAKVELISNNKKKEEEAECNKEASPAATMTAATTTGTSSGRGSLSPIHPNVVPASGSSSRTNNKQLKKTNTPSGSIGSTGKKSISSATTTPKRCPSFMTATASSAAKSSRSSPVPLTPMTANRHNSSRKCSNSASKSLKQSCDHPRSDLFVAMRNQRRHDRLQQDGAEEEEFSSSSLLRSGSRSRNTSVGKLGEKRKR